MKKRPRYVDYTTNSSNNCYDALNSLLLPVIMYALPNLILQIPRKVDEGQEHKVTGPRPHSKEVLEPELTLRTARLQCPHSFPDDPTDSVTK